MAPHLPTEPAPTHHDKTGGAPAGAPARGNATHIGDCLAGCRELLSDRGHAPGSRLAGDVLAGYQSLDTVGRGLFFDALAHEFAAAPDALTGAARDYCRNPSDANLLQLRRTSEAPRQELFLRLNAARGGTGLLVDMRHHLLDGVRACPSWAIVEADLTEVLNTLFNRGILECQQIDWETPAPILERLFEHEAVHEIRDWNDLRRRLDADRRCYALFHPSWPEEPLIFAELALTRRISATLEPLLDPAAPVVDPDTCRCVIFYSISNCQSGLRGFALGNALIGRIIETLRVQLPQLTTFATLSPIPGFHPWLSRLASRSSDSSGRFATLMTKVAASGWHTNQTAVAELQPLLVPLCVSYLLHAKEGNEPADPVARFHLSNGARLERVNWLSDISPRGLERSLGLTANYVYDLARLPQNCEAYRTAGTVTTTRQLERWLANVSDDFDVPPQQTAPNPIS